MLLNAYLICLRFTRGNIIKRIVQVGRSVLGRVQSRGVSPRTIQLGGEARDGNIPLPLMTKGERFIRCKGKFLEKEHKGMVPGGVMVIGGADPKGDTIFH
jgi:hypothetical protein